MEPININSNQQKSLSAIELLLVILTIGILVLISISFLNNARAKARDAKRLVDIRRIQTALEFYQLEYGVYPAYDRAIFIGEEPYSKLCDRNSGAFVSITTACQSEFIRPVPADPQGGKSYIYFGTETGYSLGFSLEKESSQGSPGLYYAHSTTIDNDPEAR